MDVVTREIHCGIDIVLIFGWATLTAAVRITRA